MKLIIALFALTLSFSAQAYQVPTLTGPVMDTAHMFTVQQSQDIENVIREIYQKGTAQIQVFTIPTLGEETIEQVSIQITDQWKIGVGKEGNTRKDNGLLILIAQKERKMRIEVGQGLEGEIPDAISSRIIHDVMIPYFKKGESAQGVLAAITTIYKLLAHEEMTPAADTGTMESSAESSGKIGILAALFLIFARFGFFFFIVAIIILGNIGRYRGHSRRGGGGWGGGGFGGGGFGGGGGGWSGGGGGFSGGGSSGSW
jgi:uncharacterized protein